MNPGITVCQCDETWFHEIKLVSLFEHNESWFHGSTSFRGTSTSTLVEHIISSRSFFSLSLLLGKSKYFNTLYVNCWLNNLMSIIAQIN
jgi:hypothetical protein